MLLAVSKLKTKYGMPLAKALLGLALIPTLFGTQANANPSRLGSLRDIEREREAAPAAPTDDAAPPAPGQSPAAPAAPVMQKLVVSTQKLDAERLPTLEPKEIYRRTLKSTVWIVIPWSTGMPMGTGWVVDTKQRLILTNEHVIKSSDRCNIYFPVFEKGRALNDPRHYVNGLKPIKGRVIHKDVRRDLALVQLESLPEGTSALPLATESPAPGERLFTVAGLPHGSAGLWVFSNGWVRQVVKRGLPNGGFATTVESDAATNKGNSGGAVVNDKGLVVAVVEGHMIDSRLVSLFVDISEVHSYLNDITILSTSPFEDTQKPVTASDLLRKADAMLLEGKLDNAIDTYQQVIAREPKNGAAHLGLGKAHVAKGEWNKAVKHFGDAVAADSKLMEAYWHRGIAHRHLRNLNAAQADLTQAIALDSRNANLHNERGVALFLGGKYDQALSDFNKAVELGPTNAQMHCNKGDTLRMMKRHPEAVESFKKAIALSPKSAKFYNFLGLSKFATKNYDEAGKAFRDAISHDASSAIYYHNFADAMRMLGKHEAGLKAINTALILKPSEARYYYQRGLIQVALKGHRQAVADFSKAISLDPTNRLVYVARAEAYRVLGDESAARADEAKLNTLVVR